MDKQRRKKLVEQYKARRPQMGVVAYMCKATGESFLSAAKDTAADVNGTTMKLESGLHPNARLLELWREYGGEGFSIEVLETLDCKDGVDDYTDELELLRDELIRSLGAKKVWR